jgi:hypothetical protein
VARGLLELVGGAVEEASRGFEIVVSTQGGRNSTAGVRQAGAKEERPMAKPRPDPAASDPEVEGFLALLAARRAPKTVEAYSRDLRALGDWLGGPPPRRPRRSRALARGAASGWALSATIARRVAAVRSFFRHPFCSARGPTARARRSSFPPPAQAPRTPRRGGPAADEAAARRRG